MKKRKNQLPGKIPKIRLKPVGTNISETTIAPSVDISIRLKLFSIDAVL